MRYVDTQFKPKVLCIRSDNALELSEGLFKKLFVEYGIIHQTTCAHTPQHNGVVASKHRHLLEIARALQLQAHLAYKFWGDYVLCAIYVINRMPLKSLNNATHYYTLYNIVPPVNHLRSYGCL